MGCQKDIDQLLKVARRQKFIQECAGGRWKVTSPDGERKTFVPSNASDWRALQEVRKKLRGIGVQLGT